MQHVENIELAVSIKDQQIN